MKAEMVKDLAYFEALPYTVVLRKDDDGNFIARVLEFPGCTAHGDDESAAIQHLRSVQRLWIEESLSAGQEIPEPEEDADLPSGKWIQRVPRRLHKNLATLAKREKVSLNQLVTSMLSEALTAKSCTHVFEAYLSQMNQLPNVRTFVPGGPFNYHVWFEPPDEMNQWSTRSHDLTGSLARELDSVKAIICSPTKRTRRHIDLNDEKYIERGILARE